MFTNRENIASKCWTSVEWGERWSQWNQKEDKGSEGHFIVVWEEFVVDEDCEYVEEIV